MPSKELQHKACFSKTFLGPPHESCTKAGPAAAAKLGRSQSTHDPHCVVKDA